MISTGGSPVTSSLTFPVCVHSEIRVMTEPYTTFNPAFSSASQSPVDAVIYPLLLYFESSSQLDNPPNSKPS